MASIASEPFNKQEKHWWEMNLMRVPKIRGRNFRFFSCIFEELGIILYYTSFGYEPGRLSTRIRIVAGCCCSMVRI